MLRAAAMVRGSQLRATTARWMRAEKFSTNGGGPATPGGGASTNGNGNKVTIGGGLGANGSGIGKPAGGGSATNGGGAATGGGETTNGTAATTGKATGGAGPANGNGGAIGKPPGGGAANNGGSAATGGGAANSGSAPTGKVVNGRQCSSLSALRSEVFEETTRIANGYNQLFHADEILSKEVAAVQKEMKLNHTKSAKDSKKTAYALLGSAGACVFVFGAWMSPYLNDKIVNDSVKEVGRRARMKKLDALLTKGSSDSSADGAGAGSEAKTSAPAVAPPAAAKAVAPAAATAAAKRAAALLEE